MTSRERLVIKLGSSQLTEASGRLSHEKLLEQVQALANAHEAGHEIILVTSGAVAAGFERLGFSSRPTNIAAKQGCAAVGQGLIMKEYGESFAKFNITVGQVLLSRSDFARRESYNNALNALTFLIDQRAIPIINENDTVSIERVTFGDNDMLAALVACLVHAKRLIIFTDVDGLYNKDPSLPGAQRVNEVKEITDFILDLAGGAGSKVGTGGMLSKLRAAQFATDLGVEVFIGGGDGDGRISDVLKGQGKGTYCHARSDTKKERKKQWIAFHSERRGELIIDDGAARAVTKDGKSLLPAGILDVIGDFSADDVVEVRLRDGTLLGKGIVQHSSDELRSVKGSSSDTIKKTLGTQRTEAIHRDSWVAF